MCRLLGSHQCLQPPPVLTDQQFDRLMELQNVNGWGVDQDMEAVGGEYARIPKGLGLEPHRHKAPPPQPRKKMLVFIDEEVRSMYQQVIVAHFLTMPPDPSLKNFQYAQLSVEENAKYDEEARKVEAEHLQTAAAVSAQEMNGCQHQKRMAPDEQMGDQGEWHTQDMPPSYRALHDASGRGDHREWGSPDCGMAGGKGVPMYGGMFTSQNELKGPWYGFGSTTARQSLEWNR